MQSHRCIHLAKIIGIFDNELKPLFRKLSHNFTRSSIIYFLIYQQNNYANHQK